MDTGGVIPPFERWYAGRRVFVTGHTGFKGAWISLWLQALGAEVTGYALAAETDSLFAQGNVGNGMRSLTGDVCDGAALSAAVAEADPEVVIHMAAQSLVRPSFDDPVGTFDTNVVGTATVLDAARRVASPAAIVVVTSDKCYANDGTGKPFTEHAPMGGNDPYSASKGCTELVAAAYANSFFSVGGCALATARAGNVIGGGDWSTDRIIPDLMRSVRDGEKVIVRRPNAIRPWQHVLEPLRGYLLLGYLLATGGRAYAGGWNFGPEAHDAVTVGIIVDAAVRHWPAIRAERAAQITGPDEATLLRLDCEKARDQLGWRPVFDLETALTMTIDWYRKAIERPAAQADITLDQIEHYRARLCETEGAMA